MLSNLLKCNEGILKHVRCLYMDLVGSKEECVQMDFREIGHVIKVHPVEEDIIPRGTMMFALPSESGEYLTMTNGDSFGVSRAARSQHQSCNITARPIDPLVNLRVSFKGLKVLNGRNFQNILNCEVGEMFLRGKDDRII